jgi:hypothetical protein
MKILRTLLVVGIIGSFYSCAKKEESEISNGAAKQPVSLSMGSYTTAKFSPLNFIIPSAYAAVSDFKFCFKRLRFKKDPLDATEVDDNIDLQLGNIQISNSGTLLGTVNVPAGTYTRIEFDLEPSCDDVVVNSVGLTNGNGTFNSTSTIKIKFEGTFIVDGVETLELGVQNIMTAANAFDGLGGISLKDALEAVSGNL